MIHRGPNNTPDGPQLAFLLILSNSVHNCLSNKQLNAVSSKTKHTIARQNKKTHDHVLDFVLPMCTPML